jgi:hypothetical protein
MKRRIIFVTLVIIAFALVALSGNTTPVSAKPADAYTIDWYTIDGGGATFSTGGAFELGGTVGQHDAGAQSGGTFSLASGFWNALAETANTYIYLPFIRK